MSAPQSAPQQPDFSNVVNNLNQTANTLSGYGQQGWDWAKGALSNLSPTVATATSLGQNLAQGAADSATQQRGDFAQYQPVMSRNITQAMNYDSPGNIARTNSMSAASLGQQFKAAGDAARADLESYGVKPTDARFGALDFPLKAQQAAATVGQNNANRMAMENQAFNMRQGVINTGLGEAGLANQTTGTAGSTGMLPVSAGATLLSSGAPYMAPGNYLATAGSLYGGVGNIYNQAYGNAMQGFTATQNQGSGVGTALGIGSTLLGNKGIGGLGSMGSLFSSGASGGAGMMGAVPGLMAMAAKDGGYVTPGGVIRRYDTGGPVQIEGGAPNPDRPNPGGLGHLQQPPSPDRVAGPDVARRGGEFGPGELSQGRKDWKYYYGGGKVEGYAWGGDVASTPGQTKTPYDTYCAAQGGQVPNAGEAGMAGHVLPGIPDGLEDLGIDSSHWGQGGGSSQPRAKLNAPRGQSRGGPAAPALPGHGNPYMRVPEQERMQQRPMDVPRYAMGGVLPLSQQGGYVPPAMSPSGGAQVDDIPAVIQNAGNRPAAINAGEFIFTQKATHQIGEGKLRKMMEKAEAEADSRDHPVNAGRRPTAGYGGVL